MSLYKQIGFLVSFVFLILLLTILSVSFSIIKESAQKELYENAQNSASSLALSISSTDASQSAIETLINASFDNGNYEKIAFVDSTGNTIYERKLEKSVHIIPDWFVKFATFELSAAKASVSSGWSVLGIIEVLNDRGVTYLQLYNIMINMLWYITFACIMFLIFLSFVFHIMLKPLFKIEKQAEAALNNEFVIQKTLPWTKEFKVVVSSINSMVMKFEEIFKTASNALCENKELLYTDSVTHLPNRRYFVLKATEYLTEENEKNHGSIIIISIKKADILNNTIGYQKTDKFLYDLANLIKTSLQNSKDALACRINGTEILAMIPEIKLDLADKIAQSIQDGTKQLFADLGLDLNEFGIHLGICEYDSNHTLGELCSVADYALSQAKLLQPNEHYTLLNNKIAITKERWRQIIQDGFANDSFEIMYRKAINTKNHQVFHKTISFALNSNNESYFYGTLIAPVVELGMVKDVYLYIIKKVLASKEHNNTPIAIQISSQFTENLDTYENLKKVFEETKQNNTHNIIFEIPESVINKHYDNSVFFVELFRKYGFNFGINSFMADSEDYEYLKELKPIFVKADKHYLLDTEQNINVLKIVLDSLGIQLIATGVNTKEEIDKLNKKGIEIIGGMVTDILEKV